MARKILALLIAVTIGFAAASAVYAQSSPDKLKNIKDLIGIETNGKLGEDFVNQLFGTFKAQLPSVPEDFWKGIRSEINTKELEDALVSAYDKYFSDQEIKDMITFYGTPTGKKLLSVRPQISSETFQFTQTWAAKVSNTVVQRLTEKGYLQLQQRQQGTPAQVPATK